MNNIDILFKEISRNQYTTEIKSAAGLLWLQSHFQEYGWDNLVSGKSAVCNIDVNKLINKARAANMTVGIIYGFNFIT